MKVNRVCVLMAEGGKVATSPSSRWSQTGICDCFGVFSDEGGDSREAVFSYYGARGTQRHFYAL